MLSFAHTIAAGESFSAAISNDGQVITTSGFDLYKLEYIDVKTRMEGSSQVRYSEKRQVPAPSSVDWHNIVSIAAGDSHLVGLKADGTVIAAGYNQMGQCNVDSYTNIVAVFAGNHSTVALRADGAILCAGNCKKVSFSEPIHAEEIVNISVTDSYVIVLKKDGSFIYGGYEGRAGGVLTWMRSWKGLKDISSHYRRTIGLFSDGTVGIAGEDNSGSTDFDPSTANWSRIKSVSCGWAHVVGLCEDGTVIGAGDNRDGQISFVTKRSLFSKAELWNQIVDIKAGRFHTIALKSDGRVIAVGNNKQGQCDVGKWNGIKLPSYTR